MPLHRVTVFQPYPFQVGQKIRIEGEMRAGDWEVVGITEQKVKLRCPISGREFDWPHFCYLAEEREAAEWPSGQQ